MWTIALNPKDTNTGIFWVGKEGDICWRLKVVA